MFLTMSLAADVLSKLLTKIPKNNPSVNFPSTALKKVEIAEVPILKTKENNRPLKKNQLISEI